MAFEFASTTVKINYLSLWPLNCHLIVLRIRNTWKNLQLITNAQRQPKSLPNLCYMMCAIYETFIRGSLYEDNILFQYRLQNTCLQIGQKKQKNFNFKKLIKYRHTLISSILNCNVKNKIKLNIPNRQISHNLFLIYSGWTGP